MAQAHKSKAVIFLILLVFWIFRDVSLVDYFLECLLKDVCVLSHLYISHPRTLHVLWKEIMIRNIVMFDRNSMISCDRTHEQILILFLWVLFHFWNFFFRINHFWWLKKIWKRQKCNRSLVDQIFANILIVSIGNSIWHCRSWYETKENILILQV